MKEPLLELIDVSTSYYTRKGTIPALREISLTIEAGESVALVGESGCGKSTAAQVIMGLIPESTGITTAKAIRFQGRDLLHLSENERRKMRGNQIGMIFQDPMSSLNPLMKIGSQIIEGLILHQKLSKEQAKQRALELCHKVGLSDPEERLNQYPFELSGGMRQRVMIAIAIACKPRLLIADEPTTALDVTIQNQILDLLISLKESEGMSTLLITHNIGIVPKICEKIFVMYAGKIVESGLIKEVLRNPKHPYTQALLNAIPILGKDEDSPLALIPGCPPVMRSLPKGCAFHPRCPHAMRICAEREPTSSISACWLNHPNAKRSP